MRVFVLGLSALLCTCVVSAADQLALFDWAELKATGHLPGAATVIEEDGRTVLLVSHAERRPLSVRLLAVDSPSITTLRWAFEGEIRYRDVAGSGYLEMWSLFSGGGRFFSRTLARVGPMAALSGSSKWRRFVVPFFSDPEVPAPHRLELDLVLPGPGTVAIGPVRMVQYGLDEDPLRPAGAWWSDRQAGLIGGIAGTGMGLLGALVGILTARGRSRRLVDAIMGGFVAIGAVALALGVVALAAGQPYAVWYPPGLIGLIGTSLGLTLRSRISRRFTELEERRMRAIDLG